MFVKAKSMCKEPTFKIVNGKVGKLSEFTDRTFCTSCHLSSCLFERKKGVVDVKHVHVP
jgi:hypothetical protein